MLTLHSPPWSIWLMGVHLIIPYPPPPNPSIKVWFIRDVIERPKHNLTQEKGNACSSYHTMKASLDTRLEHIKLEFFVVSSRSHYHRQRMLAGRWTGKSLKPRSTSTSKQSLISFMRVSIHRLPIIWKQNTLTQEVVEESGYLVRSGREMYQARLRVAHTVACSGAIPRTIEPPTRSPDVTNPGWTIHPGP